MLVRLGFAGDFHKRPKDITTIEGYVKCNNLVHTALIEMIKELQLDYFVSLGDWYDKGYQSDISASLADYDTDIEMSNILGNKFYGLIGNHIRLNMDSNPELHIIQPHPNYKSRHATRRKEQIMKTPDMLRIGNTQISFMHYRMGISDPEDYKPIRQDWAKYHIALFHIPTIVPNSQLAKTNMGYNSSSNTKIGRTLEGVDLAIVGDIHYPLGRFIVNTPTGACTMIVPGSLTNTTSSERDRHSAINIPIIFIDTDTDEVMLKFRAFDLKTNVLTFKQKNVEEARDKLKSLRGKPVKHLNEVDDGSVSIIRSESAHTSLNGFMLANGYTEVDKKLVRQVLNQPDNISSLLEIFKTI